MNPIVYDLSMLIGLGLAVSGVAVLVGLGGALLTAGCGLVLITAFGAMVR